MRSATHLLEQLLHLVELTQLTVDFRQFEVDLLIRVLLKQRLEALQILGKVLMVFEEQLLAFQDQLTVAVPDAETHEAVEQIFQAHVLVVTMQVIISPPQETAKVNLFLRVIMALL